ncbi:unnamed protein product [Orchesella dallaii]|uniref:protein-serine/threonine phosphatase n=1 Tax=Orchesella dallaii TaxID=48710 RepID=A0ABP1QBB3_9HEXA
MLSEEEQQQCKQKKVKMVVHSSGALLHSLSSDGTNFETSPEELKELLSDRYYGSQIPSRHYDEIFQSLYLADMKTARNVLTLEKLGITHVLNCAYSPTPFTHNGETSETYYRERNFPCEFIGIPALDLPSYKISQWFEESSQFIHDALKAKGKVLVHCQVGVSRSATLVIAYLMIKHGIVAVDAVQLVGARRAIFPNDGFLKQICELDYRLRHPRNALLRSLSVISRHTLLKIFRKSKRSIRNTSNPSSDNGSASTSHSNPVFAVPQR